MRFGSIGHITIRVADIDRSLAFYVGKFGNRIERMQMATDSKPALAVAALTGMKD